MNTLDKSSKQINIIFFEKKGIVKRVTNLKLQVGELKEVEGSIMRSELTMIYKLLREQTANVRHLEYKCSEQETQIDNMQISKPMVSHDKHIHQLTDKKNLFFKKNMVKDGEVSKLKALLREARLQL